MAPKTLSTIPPELQLAICRYIPKPSDLKSLCLSCKELRHAALPNLYKTVTINLERCQLPKLNGFFLANNAGRAYTKTLVFTKSSSDNPAMAWRTMSIAIQYLARDILTEIRLPTKLVLDLDFLLTLSTNQRQLVKIRLPPVGDSIALASSSPGFTWDWLQSVERLRLPSQIHGPADLQGFHDFIEHAGKLTELDIWTNNSPTNEVFNKEMRATSSSDGSVYRPSYTHLRQHRSTNDERVRWLTADVWLGDVGS